MALATMLTRLKRTVKWVAKPFARPVLARIDLRLQPIRHDLDALSRQLQALVDTLSSQNAVANEMRHGQIQAEARLGEVRDRMEFIRNELMYEMRYGARQVGDTTVAAIEPRVIAGERIAQLSEVRINLGCGHIPLPDFVNVDRRELDHVDVVADVHHLPFTPGSVAQIHSAHLLEHFPVEELRRSLLPYWISMLQSDGLLTAVVPDAEAMISEFSAGRMSFEELRLVTFGQQEYDQDFHFNMFSRASLCELLKQAGLVDVRIVACGRRNGVSYEMEIEGRRPTAPPVASAAMDASVPGR